MPAFRMNTQAREISLALCTAVLLALTACGGGGGSDEPGQPGGQDSNLSTREAEAGVLTETAAAGMAVFEGEAQEIAPGVLMQASAVIVATDPGDPATTYRVLWIRRISGATGAGSVRFAADIPKTFAGHVDQLRVKILANASPVLDVEQLLGEGSNFVGIAELVRQGSAQVIEEDPLVLILLGGAAAIGTTYVFFERPDVVGLTPRATPQDIFFMDRQQRGQWANDRLLGEHCADLVASARDNNIPARLLASTILNEISDYGWEDTLQEVAYTGENRSHGWVQLQPRRVLEHGLIDIGTPASVRKPGVDLTDEELVANSPPQPGEAAVTVRTSTNVAIWKRLIDPRASIELAAREVAHLLDRLKPGSPALANPWARALLADPARGIDRNDIYANLKLARQTTDPAQRQLERSLAVLLIAAYNGGGAILDETDERRIFTAEEIASNNRFPWEVPGDIDEKVIGADGQPINRYPFRDPRVHADNGATFFTEVLRANPCLAGDTSFTAEVAVPGFSLTFNSDSSRAFLGVWASGQPAVSLAATEGSGLNAESISISFNPAIVSSPGTYLVSTDLLGGAAILVYSSPDIRHANVGLQTDEMNAALSGVSGTITLDSFSQNIGGRISGSFSVQLLGTRITGRADNGNLITATDSGSASGRFALPITQSVAAP